MNEKFYSRGVNERISVALVAEFTVYIVVRTVANLKWKIEGFLLE